MKRWPNKTTFQVKGGKAHFIYNRKYKVIINYGHQNNEFLL